MDFYSKIFFICGAVFGFFAVLGGAFGSHYLKQRLSPDKLQIFEIAIRYQMYHSLVLVALAIIYNFFPIIFLAISGILFISGTIIFSGSLYLLIYTSIKKWGAVTPIGGTLLLFGWFFTFIGGLFL